MVLLNPASEFAKWKTIQAEDFSLSGYKKTPDEKSFIHNDSKYFSESQKPILISVTSTCDWAPVADFATKKNANLQPGQSPAKVLDVKNTCDWATGKIFPIAQWIGGGRTLEETTAIGHVRPFLADDGHNQDFGVTHEVEENDSSQRTTYGGAAVADNDDLCPVANGWLKVAQERMQDEFQRSWDTGIKDGIKSPKALHNLGIQFRNGSFRELFKERSGEGCKLEQQMCDGRLYKTLGPAHDPLWNVASYDSLVPDHNTVFSHPLWCALNQIVLDDITK